MTAVTDEVFIILSLFLLLEEKTEITRCLQNYLLKFIILYGF